MTQELLQHLVHTYGGPGHERIRLVVGRTIIRIDDFKRGDAPLRFCHISASFEGVAEQCTLNLYNAPVNSEVENLVRSHNARIAKTGSVEHIHLPITASDAPFLQDLADAIGRAIAVTPEQPRWKDPNWIWKCPRTAASLDRFALHLENFQQTVPESVPSTTTAPAISSGRDVRPVRNDPTNDRGLARAW